EARFSRVLRGSFATTRLYDVRSNVATSAASRTLGVSIATHFARAKYGAGTMPGRSVSSAKLSGEAFSESQVYPGTSGVTANIFPATLKTRSSPHWIFSVAPANARQISRS